MLHPSIPTHHQGGAGGSRVLCAYVRSENQEDRARCRTDYNLEKSKERKEEKQYIDDMIEKYIGWSKQTNEQIKNKS